MIYRSSFMKAAQLLNRKNAAFTKLPTSLNYNLKNFSKTVQSGSHQQRIASSLDCTQTLFNLNGATAQAAPQQSNESSQQEQQQESPKKNGFLRLFEREHVWKFSLGMLVVMLACGGGYLLLEWGAPQVDQAGNVIKDEFSDMPIVIQYPKRAIHSAFIYYQMFKDPTSDKLLPDPLQEPYYQPPYTLVIELNDVLIHPEWTYSTGWRYKKRPGLDYFIEQVKYPMFEVVFFTREPYTSLAPVVAALDPNNHVQFKLFRESTKFMNGVYVKDLSCLNRDVRKVILIDSDENAYKLQQRNAIHRLKAWKGEEDDTDLVYLATFLKTIAASGVEDVRDVLDYYNNEVNPLEAFKINQVRLQEAEEQRQREIAEWKKKQTSSPFSWARKLH